MTNLTPILQREIDQRVTEAACADEVCFTQGCIEHPAHNGPDHTYEQHHSPEDHVDLNGNPDPEHCRCTVYLEVANG